MILYLNTSKFNSLDVFLIKDAKVVARTTVTGDYKLSENLLKIIVKLLKNNQTTFKQLDGIITVSGPGPFSSLRIALAVTNTLAYTLKIPVVGIAIKGKLTTKQIITKGLKELKNTTAVKYLQPFYGQEPNITKPKVDARIF